MTATPTSTTPTAASSRTRCSRSGATKGDDRITEEERTATNASGNTYVYELPFVTLDREADMRTAYAEFERRLAERTNG